MKIINFSNIPAEPKRDLILVRLGYKKSMTVLKQEDNEFLEYAIQEAFKLCHPQGIVGRCWITDRAEDYIELENVYKIYSRSLAELLKNSDEILLMSATVGNETIDRIQYEIDQGEAALGVVIDAVASQTADASIVWMMEFVGKMIGREGKRVTRHRYSPGYGDLLLSNQKMIFEILQLQKLGLSLTEKYMLVPEKSVIAIAGIERVGN